MRMPGARYRKRCCIALLQPVYTISRCKPPCLSTRRGISGDGANSRGGPIISGEFVRRVQVAWVRLDQEPCPGREEGVPVSESKVGLMLSCLRQKHRPGTRYRERFRVLLLQRVYEICRPCSSGRGMCGCVVISADAAIDFVWVWIRVRVTNRVVIS